MPSERGLFGRTWTLRIGDKLFSSSEDRPFDMKFSVQKTNRREPNTAEINIYNIREERVFSEDDLVFLEIGYKNVRHFEAIFNGDISQVFYEKDDADSITRVICEDSGRSYADVRVSLEFPPGTLVINVIRRLLQEMNVGVGNASGLTREFARRNRPSVFETGYSCTGRAWKNLNNLIRSAGYTWSIQDGALNVRLAGSPISPSFEAVLLPDSGLIGSPTIDASASTSRKKVVIARSFPVQGLYIGGFVQIPFSESYGQITKLRYEGETFSDTWEVEIEMEEINDRF